MRNVVEMIKPLIEAFAILLFSFFSAVFVSLRSILMVELIGLNSLSNEFGLVTMCQGLSAFIGAPITGKHTYLSLTEIFFFHFEVLVEFVKLVTVTNTCRD